MIIEILAKENQRLTMLFSDNFIRCFRRDINVLIISPSSTSKKISRSMKMTRQSSKRLSPILFLNFVFAKRIAEPLAVKMVVAVAVAVAVA
jgi:hypothetical protein